MPVIKLFYPRNKGLGGFLCGTLRFEGKYASKIMKQGYEETLQTLDELNEIYSKAN
jgi:hypothetical protein